MMASSGGGRTMVTGKDLMIKEIDQMRHILLPIKSDPAARRYDRGAIVNGRKIVCAVVMAMQIIWGCGDDQPKKQPLPKSVQVITVQEETLAGGLRYSANIKPNRQVDLVFKNGGYVASLLQMRSRDVQEGDRVARGQVLATLRDRDYALKEAQAKADRTEAEAAWEQARHDYRRAENLFASGSLTKPDFEAAVYIMPSDYNDDAGGPAAVTENEKIYIWASPDVAEAGWAGIKNDILKAILISD